MKWFQTDADTPNDPKVKAVIRAFNGQTGVGALFLLWCYIAHHGKGKPGLGISAAGTPLPLHEMADECLFDDEASLVNFLNFLASKRHIDPKLWEDQQLVLLPAMFSRADAYARSKGRKLDDSGGDSGGGEPRAKAGEPGKKRAKTGERGGKIARIRPDSPGFAPTVQDSTNKQTPEEQDRGPADHPAVLPGLEGPKAPTPEDLKTTWNQTREPGPKVDVVTHDRAERYARALKAKPDLAEWALVIRWLNVQPWANAPGHGDHPNWRADLDWLVKPGKLQKWLETARADQSLPKASTPGNGRVAPTPGKFAGLKDPDET